MNSPIRILVVDDNASMRQAIGIIIEDEPDMRVCGEAETIATALQKCEALHPDLALVDISLKGEDGLDLIRRMRECFPALRTVVFSLHDEKHYIDLARAAGAHGYAVKSGAPDALLTAMRDASASHTLTPAPDVP